MFLGLASPVPACPGEAVLCIERIRRARGEGRREEEKEGWRWRGRVELEVIHQTCCQFSHLLRRHREGGRWIKHCRYKQDLNKLEPYYNTLKISINRDAVSFDASTYLVKIAIKKKKERKKSLFSRRHTFLGSQGRHLNCSVRHF